MSDFDTQSEAFLQQIERDLASGNLSFPTVMDLSLRIKKVADDPNSSLEQIAELVGIEPLLSARIVRIANSVTFNPAGKTVASVYQAALRIGVSSVRATALATAIEQLAGEDRNPAMRSTAHQVWRHSIDVAAWSCALARHLGISRPDTALLAGLVSNLGQLYLISISARFPAIAADAERFTRLVAASHGKLSKAIAARLGLPQDVVGAFDFASPYRGHWPPDTLAEILYFAGLAAEPHNPFAAADGTDPGERLEAIKQSLVAPSYDELLAGAELERDELLAVLLSA